MAWVVCDYWYFISLNIPWFCLMFFLYRAAFGLLCTNLVGFLVHSNLLTNIQIFRFRFWYELEIVINIDIKRWPSKPQQTCRHTCWICVLAFLERERGMLPGDTYVTQRQPVRRVMLPVSQCSEPSKTQDLVVLLKPPAMNPQNNQIQLCECVCVSSMLTYGNTCE